MSQRALTKLIDKRWHGSSHTIRHHERELSHELICACTRPLSRSDESIVNVISWQPTFPIAKHECNATLTTNTNHQSPTSQSG